MTVVTLMLASRMQLIMGSSLRRHTTMKLKLVTGKNIFYYTYIELIFTALSGNYLHKFIF